MLCGLLVPRVEGKDRSLLEQEVRSIRSLGETAPHEHQSLVNLPNLEFHSPLLNALSAEDMSNRMLTRKDSSWMNGRPAVRRRRPSFPICS